MIRLA